MIQLKILCGGATEMAYSPGFCGSAIWPRSQAVGYVSMGVRATSVKV
jgi:hypothetical protein